MKTPAARLKKFWWWINERHRIYLKKRDGEPWPWTKDKIMQTYSFTNVFRELDAETLKLHERINPFEYACLSDKLYCIILYRAFNLASTYDLLARYKNGTTNVRKMKKILHRAADDGQKIFTGAYIITNSGQRTSKIDLVCDALGVMYRGRYKIWDDMVFSGMSMESCTKVLMQYPMQGPFTSYEVICDMRHQKGMLDKAPDRRTWANPGPGARRGINRIVGGRAKGKAFRTSDEYVEFMVELLKSSRSELGPHVPKRKIEMREIEHSLCEYDKWCRAYLGEGRPRRRYRRQEEVR